MARMGIYDQIKSAFQDLIAPEIHAMRGEIAVINQKLAGLDAKIDNVDARLNTRIDSLRSEVAAMKNELVAETRTVDVRVEGLAREIQIAMNIRERLVALEARRSSDEPR
jgi:predicted  nucleic acid-binding Zn-ribbon protein